MTAENRVVGPDGHVDVDFLADFAEGLLSGADAATAEAHIATCADCRATFDALAEVRTLLAGHPAEPMPADVYASIQDALADAAAADALLAETGFRPAAATPAFPAADADSDADWADFAAPRRARAVPAAPIAPAPAPTAPSAPSVPPVPQPPAGDGATRFLGAAPAPHAAPPAPRSATDPTQVLGAAPGSSGSAGAEDATRVIGAGDVHPFGVAAVPPMQPPPPPMPAPGSAPGGGPVVALDSARRRKRRYLLLAAAAAGVVLVGVGAVTLLGSSSDDSKTNASEKGSVAEASQPRDAAPSAGASAPTRTGGGQPGAGTAAAPNAPASSPTTLPAYTRADLSVRVSAMLDRQTSAATGVKPGATTSSDPGRTQPDRETPVTLPACVSAQSRHDKPPTAAELARYEGRTAYVLAYAEPGRRNAEVVVIDASCAFARPGSGDQTSGVLLETVVQVR
ncbi:anti-sigma factor family protein [Uniformispora flossi]|uniref:anti-sigma factor family protein n=1 Tax=Uniformispora flossi TaxID=3390723 RepID=UPI003C307EF5